MDIAKCFDKMWYEETGNDIYNAGVTDDKFVLLANSNSRCKVAVKTPWGSTTERVELQKIEMQGTVLAPLKASIQLDTLGKDCFETGEGLFKYKGCVNLPPLIMIDDILAISSCGNDSVKMNAIVHSKIDSKQLMFGPKKCFKLHIGNKCQSTCPTLKVHNQVMATVEKEKYLGDILSNDGKININIQERQNKGTGYVNQIVSMLREVSFGYHFFNMAMLFRTTMLINGMLCSSEALYGITTAHLEQLESCDTMLFKSLFQSPCTTPIAAYFLETGAVPIRFLIKGRRLMYLWTILQKSDDELVRKVFNAQKLFPVKDDFIHQIEKDLEDIGMEFDEEMIKKMKKTSFRELIREKIKTASHSYLLQKKESLSKLDNLSSNYSMKDYLKTNKLSTQEKQLLFNLRTRMIHVKCNYGSSYSSLLCSLCDTNSEESQEHLLVCPGLVEQPPSNTTVQYLDIFGDLDKQVVAVQHWTRILNKRKVMLKEKESSLARDHVH